MELIFIEEVLSTSIQEKRRKRKSSKKRIVRGAVGLYPWGYGFGYPYYGSNSGCDSSGSGDAGSSGGDGGSV